MAISERWIRKYMLVAKHFGETDNRCYSRQIGVAIVDPEANKVLSLGLNGPPRGTPPCDDEGYLRDVFIPQLSEFDRGVALGNARNKLYSNGVAPFVDNATFCTTMRDCKVCPRRLINAKSGERLELCSCAHGETNAIVNAGCDLNGTHMFCWCCIPCVECTKLIINAGIKRVYCLDPEGTPDYSQSSRFLFNKAGVEVVLLKKGDLLDGPR